MKNILKLGLIAVLFFFAASCDNTELDLLDNPNEVTPENAELDLLFNKVVLDFGEFTYNISLETQPYTRMLAMSAGNQYNNQDAPTSFDGEWRLAYSRMLPDMELILQLAADGGFTTHAGITKVMKAYVLFTLVDMWGDVPFSEALQGVENSSPAADDDESVYNAALALLDEAIDDLKNPVGSPANDLFFGGNAAAWTTLANTLKIRYYVTTRLVNGSAAKSGIDGILSAGDIMDMASEDFEYPFGDSRNLPDSRHPLYGDAYDGDGADWYLSNYYMWTFMGTGNSIRDNEDPRLRYYFLRQDCDETDEDQFTLDCPTAPYPFHWPVNIDYPFCTASGDFGDPDDLYGGYWGRDHGNNDGIPPDGFKRTAVGLYPAGGVFDADNCADANEMGTTGAGGAGIQPIFQSSYTHFLLAEAALTLGTTGDPATYLEEGIRQSIAKAQSFGSLAAVDESLVADVDTYVTETLDKFAAADDEGKLNIVMQEYHKALWGQGLDAYNNYRRTGMPLAMQPTREEDFGTFSRLMWYPAVFVNLNAKVSQRTTDQQVFWDNNPAGFIE